MPREKPGTETPAEPKKKNPTRRWSSSSGARTPRRAGGIAAANQLCTTHYNTFVRESQALTQKKQRQGQARHRRRKAWACTWRYNGKAWAKFQAEGRKPALRSPGAPSGGGGSGVGAGERVTTRKVYNQGCAPWCNPLRSGAQSAPETPHTPPFAGGVGCINAPEREPAVADSRGMHQNNNSPGGDPRRYPVQRAKVAARVPPRGRSRGEYAPSWNRGKSPGESTQAVRLPRGSRAAIAACYDP